jgi:hypothetical protein
MASLFEKNKDRLRIQRHIESMRLCWPEWEGPRVEDSVHGRCSVHPCCCFSITQNTVTYHSSAPVKITEIRPDGSVIGFIDYIPDPDDPDQSQGVNMCARNYNGEVVLLQPDEIWPPVTDLWAMHYAEELAEAKEQGTRCECGGEIVSKYGGIFRCKPCIDALKAANLEAIKPKRKKKKP